MGTVNSVNNLKNETALFLTGVGSTNTDVVQSLNVNYSGATPTAPGDTGGIGTSLGCGPNATANDNGGTAVGPGATATGVNSVAVGHGATASDQGAVAVGQGATAGAVNATAVGQGATANNTGLYGDRRGGDHQRRQPAHVWHRGQYLPGARHHLVGQQGLADRRSN